jgi:hypothetical protein
MVHLSRITSSSEREARQILDSVKSGRTSFEDAARNQSVDRYKDQGGDTGLKMAYEMYSDIPDEAERNSVLTLGSGDYSELVTTPSFDGNASSNWAFYRAEANPYNADFSQQENLDKARSYMGTQAGGRIEDWLVARAEEFIAIAKENGFEEAAAESELEVQQFGPLNLNYGNVSLFNTLSNEGLQAAVSNENFWKIAFTTPLNTPSAPFTVGTDVIVIEASSETIKDDADKSYTSDFYAGGYWMYNAVDSDLRTVVFGSGKFVNNFESTYMGIMLQSLLQ